jgi:chromosome segregation protein
MFLTSLTMRGFKSFADATTLEVEPGITVVVGPNGSGKSNIVDALSWVLGTHSVKKVRGSAMTDVIFAGSPGRARGRRARVEIVIDNADGRLEPSGVGTAGSAGRFREVRIARTIEEDGLGVYEINGEEVRALDVQELLSDTGLGRELHTIVGQGQLDEILNARPEDRRKYIEEAAGILKHRRRRERAVKKLETVDEHVDKLRTVLRELRRQLRPLEQQAKAADRHAALQAELREVRVQRAARELALLDLEALDAGRDEDEARTVEQELERAVEASRAAERELSEQLEVAAREGGEGDERFHALSRLGERLRGTHELVVATRRRLAEAAEEPLLERTGEVLRAEADTLEAQHPQLQAAVDEATAQHDAARETLRAAERARNDHADARADRARARAVAVERRTRRRSDLTTLMRRIEERTRERDRIVTRLGELQERDDRLSSDMDRLRDDIHRLDAGEATLAEALDVAEAKLHSATGRLEGVREETRRLGSERAAQLARAEALHAAAADATRSAEALVAAGLAGVHGSVMDLLEVEPADRIAVATALGPLGRRSPSTSEDALTRAVDWLRASEGGASLLVARDGDDGHGPHRCLMRCWRCCSDAGARAVTDVVRGSGGSPAARRVAAASVARSAARSSSTTGTSRSVSMHVRRS